MIKFTVEGNPVAQGRPRFSSVNGVARVYDPADSRQYKELVRFTAVSYAPPSPLTSPVCLKLDVYRPIPASFSKKKRLDAENGLLRPVTKPDGSNYLKLVEDALNGLIWADDSQVVDAHVGKWYSSNPRIEVTVLELKEAAV